MDKALKIWLIDDDNLNNMIFEMEMVKTKLPITLTTFTDPIEALEFLISYEDKQPDIIFLDIKMDGMSGWEFLKKITDKKFGIPVIMATTSISEFDKEKAKQHPLVIDYVVKPIYKFKLLIVLDKIKNS